MMTLKDVAQKAHLSVSTISHILHGQDPRYSSSTRRRVEKIAKALGYRPDALARSLVQGKTNSIGVVGHDFITAISMGRVEAIASFAQQRGYHMFLAGRGIDLLAGGERKIIEGLLSRRIDGLIIFAGIGSDFDYHRELAKQGIPIVLSTHRPIPGLPCVTINTERGYYEATRHLLARGHRKIAFAVGSLSRNVTRNRLQGYERALKSYGLRINEKLFPSCERMSLESSYEFTNAQIRKRHRPTAIIYANDEQAIAGIHALDEAGMEVPKDISVVGCDDLPIAAHTSPPLTTVYQPKGEVGRVAVELLMKQIAGGPRRKVGSVELLSKLIVRQSTGRAPDTRVGP